ncbi:MAG TPA: beta-galactosidase [Capsulimonadaceae bacterium]|nr:beta-galactosidase [Capsulimonadaceae bacterium]
MDRQVIKDVDDYQSDSPLFAVAGQPPMIVDAAFSQGTSRSPHGRILTVDSRSLLLDGARWLPVMGEFHNARYPRSEWRDELLKMKLGGLDIVASYVFWIHHEEVEGEFDWSGQRDLAAFIRLCSEVGLLAVVRCGPWCHGECRNGGFPDWLLAKGFVPRSDDPRYLRYVERLYAQIAAQLKGLLWKDGGPVIGVQCENEYGGPAEHLLTLKRLAREAGLDVPLYTRTGWPRLRTPMPFGQFLPLFGGYPDGFWDRSTAEMPLGYRENFLFRSVRTEIATGADQLGVREAKDDDDIACYPYFACEIGGGMLTSYHRRIVVTPKDIESLGLAKLGSGNNLQGYYMYHGGTNPDGKLTTLQESQATGYWNDLPEKTYDYQAPLGEFGQVREHYHRLRRMHLFLRDFGQDLAGMPTRLPDDRPATAEDTSTLRWCIRTNGKSGFLFVNNYQRLMPMPRKENVQFQLQLAKGDLRIPAEPTTVPADCAFFWPFHLDMDGAHLVYATGQPICRLIDGGVSYYVFSEVDGLPAEFVFDPSTADIEAASGRSTRTELGMRVSNLVPGTESAIRLHTRDGLRVEVILLTSEQSLACWKAELSGRERLFLTKETLLAEGDTARLRGSDADTMSVSILPAPAMTGCAGKRLAGEADGLFLRFTACSDNIARNRPVAFTKVKEAGVARTVRLGSQGVAESPADEDFEQAAVWHLHLDPDTDLPRNSRLRISYVGDVARVYLGGKLLTDNFYNGTAFEIGLNRYAAGVRAQDLVLKILPLRKDAPIYLPTEAWPQFGDSEQAATLSSVALIDEEETIFASINETQSPVAYELAAMASAPEA